jgi:hypothetical protein
VRQIFKVFFVCLIIVFNIPAFADQYVHGYTRSNGTYVQPYFRSSPDGTVTNNFSFKGNANPYTGAIGKNRYIHDKTSPYYEGPDSHGKIGHNGSNPPNEIPIGNPAIEIPIGSPAIEIPLNR